MSNNEEFKGEVGREVVEYVTSSRASPSSAAASLSEVDGKLFAAALYVITSMWHDEMDDLQRASLANQIVREIERRGIIQPAAAAEAPCSEGVNPNPPKDHPQ